MGLGAGDSPGGRIGVGGGGAVITTSGACFILLNHRKNMKISVKTDKKLINSMKSLNTKHQNNTHFVDQFGQSSLKFNCSGQFLELRVGFSCLQLLNHHSVDMVLVI